MEKPLERLIFASRWLQAPLYLGLIIAQGIYVYQFFIELWHLLGVAMHGAPAKGPDTSTTIMLAVLGLIDVVMIANLLLMVIVGGYETFVSRLNLDTHPGSAGVVEPCERRRAQSQTRDGADQHFLDSPAQDVHRSSTAHHRLQE